MKTYTPEEVLKFEITQKKYRTKRNSKPNVKLEDAKRHKERYGVLKEIRDQLKSQFPGKSPEEILKILSERKTTKS